jgi:hypothetical protein
VGVEEEFVGCVELDASGVTWTDVGADPPEGVAATGFAADGVAALLAADGVTALLTADGAVVLLGVDGAVVLLGVDGAMALFATVTEAACEGTAPPAAGTAGLT